MRVGLRCADSRRITASSLPLRRPAESRGVHRRSPGDRRAVAIRSVHRRRRATDRAGARALRLIAALPLLLAGAAAVAVPPPLPQVAADCEASVYASDRLVCSDASLRALDARVRDAWIALDLEPVLAPGAWVETQDAWFKRRSLCAFSERHAECLRAAYIERVAVVEVLRLAASRTARPGIPMTCRDAPWGRAVVRLREPDAGGLTVEDSDARVLAVATPRRADPAWTPHAGFEAQGDAVRLEPMHGPIVVCSPVEQR